MCLNLAVSDLFVLSLVCLIYQKNKKTKTQGLFFMHLGMQQFIWFVMKYQPKLQLLLISCCVLLLLLSLNCYWSLNASMTASYSCSIFPFTQKNSKTRFS